MLPSSVMKKQKKKTVIIHLHISVFRQKLTIKDIETYGQNIVDWHLLV